MNRLAASMLRSSAAASCLPVTAAQASAVSSSSTHVSSMNLATSGGCCSRAPEVVLDASATKRLPLRDLDFLLPRLIIEIRDGQRVLQPLADPATAEQAEKLGREAGLSSDELSAAVEAAILQSAIQ